MIGLAAVAGAALILLVLWEGFETIILPRRVTRQFRLTRGFYRCTWALWTATLGRVRGHKRRQSGLSYYGPLSLLALLVVWVCALVTGFALLHWASGSQLRLPAGTHAGFATDLYMSGTTFFTLGLGDITPQSAPARVLTVVESGMGFGFLAMIIGYLPTLYSAFSRREVSITLLDARAGSPPSAVELLRRSAADHGAEFLAELLRDWERWSAELLESHLSYPVLCFYRSQHDNQSWVGALTTILDACALVIAGIEGVPKGQAQLTFAGARHAVVDLAQIFSTAPRAPADRLPPERLGEVRAVLARAGWNLKTGPEAEARLTELRAMYEPYVHALGAYLRLGLPDWLPSSRRDNWQTSAWGRGGPGAASPAYRHTRKDDHF